MRDDSFRTPLYYAAIRERLKQADPGTLTVLDLGTGAEALLALEAARAGAKHVYAIEADSASAESARKAVAAAGFEDVVEIFEGLSVDITLPEKVDVLISEICGSVVSAEGLYAAISDAHKRHVKHPTDPQSWIPHRCQTLGAPARYALQFVGIPLFKWLHKSLASLYEFASACHEYGLPANLVAGDEALMLLASPSVLEDVSFTDPQTLLGAGHHPLTSSPVTFHIHESRLSANEATLRAALTEEGVDAAALDVFAPLATRGFSGIAMWPRLELDPAAKFVVEGRGKGGAPRHSSWRTLLPFVDKKEPVPIAHGSTVTAQLHVELGAEIDDQPRYTLHVNVTDAAEIRSKDERNQFDRAAKRAIFQRLSDPLHRWWSRTTLEQRKNGALDVL
eukprot:gnl/TRDRNA2_/TRDRNA2_127425_c1_seq1.p1 gnl/TRDRNA2_/TRDRNA2_127425_c1~~gnl/TRDRNA2_/TRDRNA2_127425_c1_seq1.p1  ORF type:complete len:419 (+),score=65.33 gnl/TRDRNA2_/TRDRNA2_127425_c1_seq1:81-1259(+)